MGAKRSVGVDSGVHVHGEAVRGGVAERNAVNEEGGFVDALLRNGGDGPEYSTKRGYINISVTCMSTLRSMLLER